ncbi:hypothetical protein ACFVWP_46940 [Streptomyces sp. NPDC058175]|uniref:hypothetical protein n=1 Tax=Streptomyces sp. NPDC058175 TaxID=3346367 RepID=UPI0036F13E91
MNRTIRWTLLIGFLVVVGMWPAATAPVELACAGVSAIVAAVPGPLLLAVMVVGWLKYRPAPVKAKKTKTA